MSPLILALIALVLGIVAVVESRGRDWAGWGVVVLAVVVLLPILRA
jgi:hypothetical protein